MLADWRAGSCTITQGGSNAGAGGHARDPVQHTASRYTLYLMHHHPGGSNAGAGGRAHESIQHTALRYTLSLTPEQNLPLLFLNELVSVCWCWLHRFRLFLDVPEIHDGL